MLIAPDAPAPAPVEETTDPPVEDDDAKPADTLTCAAMAAEPLVKDADTNPLLPYAEAPVRKAMSPEDPDTVMPEDMLTKPLALGPATTAVLASTEPELAA